MTDRNLTERVLRGTGATFGAQLVGYLSKGLLTVVLARVLLTSEEFGLLFYALSVVGIGAFFSEFGLAKSAARYVAEYDETDPGQVPHILRVSLLVNLVPITTTSLAFLVFGPQIAALLGDPALAPFLQLAAFFVAVRSLYTFQKLSFQGFNRVTWSALVGSLASTATLVFAVAFVVVGLGAVGAFLGFATGSAVAVLVGFVLLYRRFYTKYTPAPSMEEGLTGRIVRYSVPLTFTRGAGMLDHKVDTVLVGIISGPFAVGLYTIGKQIAELAIAPATALGFTVAPAYGEQKAKHNLEKASRLYQTSLEHVLLLYIPAAVGLVVVAEPIVRTIFGTPYLGAVPVIQLFAGFVVVKAVDKITNDSLDYLAKARARAIIKGAGSVSNFGLNLLLIPVFGAVGAAGATVVTTTAIVLGNVYLIHHQLGLDLGSLARTVGLVAAISVPMAISVEFVLGVSSNPLTLGGAVVVGVLIWALLAVLSGAIDPSDIRTLLA